MTNSVSFVTSRLNSIYPIVLVYFYAREGGGKKLSNIIVYSVKKMIHLYFTTCTLNIVDICYFIKMCLW